MSGIPVTGTGMPREDRRAALAAAGATLLGSFALLPVFTTTAWLRPVLSVVLVVYGTGRLLRRGGPALWARLRPGHPVPGRLGTVGVLAVPLLQLAAALCVLTMSFAPADAWARVVPTADSLAGLATVLGEGVAELREQATPALPLTGLLALTTVLVALIAVAMDLVAVTGRQAGLAGLGLLGLYCVPVSTVTGGIGLAPLLAPATGFALLLWADQRRRLAGGDRATARATTTATGSRAAVRTGMLAMAAGVLLGSVVPTLPEGSFGTGLGGGAAAGGTIGTALDPVAALQGQLTLPEPFDLMRVEADADDPGHLRAVVLDQYDVDSGWSMSNLDSELSVAEPELAPLPPGQAGRRVVARFTARGHDDRFMPVLWSPLSVSVPDPENWRFDRATGTIFGRDTTTERRTWHVVADQPQPSPAALQAAPALDLADPLQQRFTELPELDPAVPALVGELVAGAVTPYERVRSIHDYLIDRSNGFIYSLSTAPGTSDDDLVNFLRLKRGYCEQYAGAMAVMVRAAGVPARVALGYTPGEVQPDGTRLVTTDDAHAWVEVYFGGLGWVPFDPTPIAADRAVQLAWAPRATDDRPDTAGPSEPSEAPTAAPSPRADRGATAIPDFGSPDTAAGWARPVLLGAAAVLFLVALTALPAAARVHQRRRRVAQGDARSLWDELTATVQDLGLPADPAWTPRETARQLAGAAGRAPDPLEAEHAQRAVHRLALAEESASFGRSGAPADPEQTAALHDALHAARRGLRHSVPRWTRWRAAVWPVSLRAAVAEQLVARTQQLGGRLRRSRAA